MPCHCVRIVFAMCSTLKKITIAPRSQTQRNLFPLVKVQEKLEESFFSEIGMGRNILIYLVLVRSLGYRVTIICIPNKRTTIWQLARTKRLRVDAT